MSDPKAEDETVLAFIREFDEMKQGLIKVNDNIRRVAEGMELLDRNQGVLNSQLNLIIDMLRQELTQEDFKIGKQFVSKPVVAEQVDTSDSISQS